LIRKTPNKCSICGNKAIYTAKFKGFCKNHKSEANMAMKEVNMWQELRNWRKVRKNDKPFQQGS